MNEALMDLKWSTEKVAVTKHTEGIKVHLIQNICSMQSTQQADWTDTQMDTQRIQKYIYVWDLWSR